MTTDILTPGERRRLRHTVILMQERCVTCGAMSYRRKPPEINDKNVQTYCELKGAWLEFRG